MQHDLNRRLVERSVTSGQNIQGAPPRQMAGLVTTASGCIVPGSLGAVPKSTQCSGPASPVPAPKPEEATLGYRPPEGCFLVPLIPGNQGHRMPGSNPLVSSGLGPQLPTRPVFIPRPEGYVRLVPGSNYLSNPSLRPQLMPVMPVPESRGILDGPEWEGSLLQQIDHLALVDDTGDDSDSSGKLHVFFHFVQGSPTHSLCTNPLNNL